MCRDLVFVSAMILPWVLMESVSAAAPSLPGATPVATQETTFDGDDWSATVYSYVFDEGTVTPSGLIVQPGEVLFVYLIAADEASASSITIALVTNPCEQLVNTVGYINDVVPEGFETARREAPFIYGYSAPSDATVWNYTGNPEDPTSTLDPGEWSLLFHVAETDAWSLVEGAVSTGGAPVAGEVLGASTVEHVADINGDGVVSVEDLTVVLMRWGEVGGPADIDGEPGVGIGDLLLVLDQFGAIVDC
jgi:hypothetical protein